jgi:hypothetical protein
MKLLDSYERSKICSVSKLFEFTSVSASKQLSTTPKLYDNHCLYNDLFKKFEASPFSSVERIQISSEIKDITCRILTNRDYHLVVRLKCYTIIRKFELICEIGYIPIVELMIRNNRDTNFNDCLMGACKGGHKTIIDLMIEKGANELSYALYGACIGGNMNIINFIITKCEPEYFGEDETSHWDWGLSGACRGGHKFVAKLMIEKGAGDYHDGFREACSEGQISAAKLMLQYITDGTEGVSDACYNGHNHIIELVIKKKVANIDWDFILSIACEKRDQKIIETIKSQNIGQCNHCNKSIKEH